MFYHGEGVFPFVFSYDPYFKRLVAMKDGIGTTNYTYQPVGALGALRVATEDGPYTHDTITYQYDTLGVSVQPPPLPSVPRFS